MHRNSARTNHSATSTTDDRRTEPRERARGPVRLEPDEHTCGGTVEAELVDESRGGFRARYPAPSLVSGQRVAFTSDTRCGTAIVVWSRVVGRQAESGFLVLDSEPLP